MTEHNVGILLQGIVNDWTKKVIDEYEQNFPDAHILLSTWNTENTKDICCDVIKLEPPNDPSHINHQIIGIREGLKKINSEIIMKCRTDQFIHNKNIFNIFENGCSKNKIMIPNFFTSSNVEYWASDFCQIGYRETLLEFWNSIQYFDGNWDENRTSFENPITEIFLTANYIIKGKKDLRPWDEIIGEYYYVKDYTRDFQIEWERFNNGWYNKRFFDLFYKKCCAVDK
jgi:hypothetical protein